MTMSQDMQIGAMDVSEALLEVTGDALLSGDFDAFASVFHVPQTMVTMAGSIYMETVDDMRRAFDDMHSHFMAIGVTDIVRKCVSAEYKSPTRIESTHVSDLLHNGKRLKEPYPVFSTLEKIDGQWKVISGEYALEPTNGQALALARADTSRRPQAPS